MQNKKWLWKRLRYLCIEGLWVLSHQKSFWQCQFWRQTKVNISICIHMASYMYVSQERLEFLPTFK